MKTRMVNRIVNKYLLHNRSIQFRVKTSLTRLWSVEKILIEAET